jgi:hypothetical protein
LQVQPEISLIVGNKRIDSITGKAIPDGEGLLSSVSPRDDSKICGAQYSVIGSHEQLIYFSIEAGNSAVLKGKYLDLVVFVSAQIALKDTCSAPFVGENTALIGSIINGEVIKPKATPRRGKNTTVQRVGYIRVRMVLHRPVETA